MKMIKLKLTHLMIAIFICGSFCATKVNAQCDYGPAMVVCYSDPGSSMPECCGWLWICLLEPGTGVVGAYTLNPVTAFGPSCAAGTTATGLGTGFNGTCGYSQSGVDCGTPFGPTPETVSYTAYPCSGSCE